MKPRPNIRAVPNTPAPDPIGEMVAAIEGKPGQPLIDRTPHVPKVSPFASSDPFKSDNAGLFYTALGIRMAGTRRPLTQGGE